MIRPNLSLTPTEQARLDELTLKATLPSWLRTHVHDAAEIERLRAENERLQALIDAHAAAESHCDYVASLQREVFDPEVQRMWDETYDALLAAATKKDDRG